MRFSVVSIVALLSVFAAAKPVAKRSAGGTLIFTKGADYILVTSQQYPNTPSPFGTQTAIIERDQGQNEQDSYLSFAMPEMTDIPGATASSTCNFVIKNPTSVSGSAITQLFRLGAPFTAQQGLTWNDHPYVNQYYGSYSVAPGTFGGDAASTPLDVSSFPCLFGQQMQFVLRPENDNDLIHWIQNDEGSIGAFIEVRN